MELLFFGFKDGKNLNNSKSIDFISKRKKRGLPDQ
jgi:hypothetical protein